MLLPVWDQGRERGHLEHPTEPEETPDPLTYQCTNGPRRCQLLSQSHSYPPTPSDPGGCDMLAPVLLEAVGVCAEKRNLIIYFFF